jgi:hypothetical protein
MCSMPSWASARPTWGRHRLVDLAAGLGGVEVVAAAIGVERAEQAVRRDRLGQAEEARHRPFLRDQERRVDLARRIVERDDQVELAIAARQPGEARAILEQQHPR